MLPDAIFFFFFQHFCFDLKDAIYFLIACGIKPRGYYCNMLVKSFLRLKTINFNYYKIRSYIPLLRLNGKYARLRSYVLCDKRFLKHNKIIFHSPVLRVNYIGVNTIQLQDMTTFFHLRLRGFFSNYVREIDNVYLMRHFKKYFRFDNLIIKRFRLLRGSCYLTQDLYVRVSLAIHYDAVENCFYPHVCDYTFLPQ